MSAEIRLFLCRQDNYGVLLHDPSSGATASIDAPEAAAIEKALDETGWRLTDILVTHHHPDHTAGIPELKARHNCRVVAPRKEAGKIPNVDLAAQEGDLVAIGALQGRVLETPGHTLGHVSYWFEKDKLVFAGDTLFSIGCGRVFEGDPQMMWNSLMKLRELPGDTLLYCGHEYTAANIRFALTVEPTNPALQARDNEVRRLREQGRPTIPVAIAAERTANPFLRADVASLAGRVGLEGAPPAQVFAAIRARKDTF